MLTDAKIKEIEKEYCRVHGKRVVIVRKASQYFIRDEYEDTETIGMSEVEMERLLVGLKQSKAADKSYHFDHILILLGFGRPTMRTSNTYYNEQLGLHVPTAITLSELMDVVRDHCIREGRRIERERQKQAIIDFLTAESTLSEALATVLKQYV